MSFSSSESGFDPRWGQRMKEKILLGGLVLLGLALGALAFPRVLEVNVLPRVITASVAAPSTLSLITEPSTGAAPVLAAIQGATRSVDLVIYQLEDAQIEQALAADAARGVAVRVLLNGGYYAKKEKRNDPAYNFLQSHGVPVHFTPTHFALTHQKTLVVDGSEAFIMTFNLVPKYYATGRDFAVVDTDPSDVSAIEDAFDADWRGEEITAKQGSALVWSPGSEAQMLALINTASSTLDIYNEEMADTAVTAALVAAAKRGVLVRVDMTYATNWKKAFQALTMAGARVRTFASTSKILYIHAKMIVKDGTVAFLGSENFSPGSLLYNRELGIIISAPNIISSLQKTFESDWSMARPFKI